MTMINCEICYSSISDDRPRLDCDCLSRYCEECVGEWVVTEVKNNALNDEITVRCPSMTCKQPYPLQAFVGILSWEHQQVVCDAALAHYGVHAPDVRRCPGQNCSNFGVIPLKACQEPLTCDQCQT